MSRNKLKMNAQSNLTRVGIGNTAHIGIVINEYGKSLGNLSIETNATGYQHLLKWSQSFDNLRRAGIEGTGLARFFSEQGVEVFEINRPDRTMRRFKGKSDPTDAESAARTVLSDNACAIPKLQSGAAEALQIVEIKSSRTLRSSSHVR